MRVFYLCIFAIFFIACKQDGSKTETKSAKLAREAAAKKEKQTATKNNKMNQLYEQSAKSGNTENAGVNRAKAGDKGGGSLAMGNLQFTVPDNWVKEKPNSKMRFSQHYLKSNPEYKVAGFYFGNKEGLEEANIKRWKDEFVNILAEDIQELTDEDIKLITLKGIFKSKGIENGERKIVEINDHMTVASIVQTNKGPFYFKLVGPQNVIENEVDNFKNFLNSVKKQEPAPAKK